MLKSVEFYPDFEFCRLRTNGAPYLVNLVGLLWKLPSESCSLSSECPDFDIHISEFPKHPTISLPRPYNLRWGNQPSGPIDYIVWSPYS